MHTPEPGLTKLKPTAGGFSSQSTSQTRQVFSALLTHHLRAITIAQPPANVVKSVPSQSRWSLEEDREISEPSPCAPPFRGISKTGTMNVPTTHFFGEQPLIPFLERVNRLTETAQEYVSFE